MPEAKTTWKLLAVLLCGAALALSGCARFGEVSGVVKHKGQPLAAGTIVFYDEGNHTWSSDVKDGVYKVPTVPTGKAKVVVLTPQPISLPGVPAPKTVALNPKYSDPEKSGLSYDIHSGQQKIDMDLVD
jgi:hypothetical protein